MIEPDGFYISVERDSIALALGRIESIKHMMVFLIPAMEKWAGIVVDMAKENVPVLTGDLKDDINWLVVEATEEYIKAKVSLMDPSGRQLPYAWITEMGGVINAAPGSSLHWVNNLGEHVFAKQVYHPPQPFLYPALQASRESGIKLITQALNDAVEYAKR